MGGEKKRIKMNPVIFLPMATYPMLFLDAPILKLCGAAITVAWIVWTIRWVISEDKEKAEVRKRQLREQRIRELEGDLGMEPMDLWSDEDPDIVGQRIEKEK